MNKFVDITGETYGSRTVVCFSHQNKKSRNLYWQVVCNDCGHEGIVMGSRLKAGSGCPSCQGRINGKKGLYSQSKGLPVYFVGCRGYMKVGSSSEPDKRLRTLQVFNPYELDLIHVDYNTNEEEWHMKLKHLHHRGEWYKRLDSCEIVDLT